PHPSNPPRLSSPRCPTPRRVHVAPTKHLCTGSGIRADRITATQRSRRFETRCRHAVTSLKDTVPLPLRCAWPECEAHFIVKEDDRAQQSSSCRFEAPRRFKTCIG